MDTTNTRRSVHTMWNLSKGECMEIIKIARDMKANPKKYRKTLKGKTVLMMFEKPSLRTRVSLESGIFQMGGHGIFYSLAESPLSKGKETIHDTAKSASRYVDLITARLKSRADYKELQQHATVPVVNLLDDFGHPCQILADLQTISERKDITKKLKISYYGDCNNNVTFDLMRVCARNGYDMDLACPNDEMFMPEKEILSNVKQVAAMNKSVIRVIHSPLEAAKDADVIYTDTWMSYHCPASETQKRRFILRDYQVTEEIMKAAKPDAIFMHCLPATRGDEMTAEVIDGPQSVVFDQAENRLHTQKALLLFLIGNSSSIGGGIASM